MWFMCIRRNVRPPEQRTVTLDVHLGWLKQQHDAGSIVLSGPSPDRSLGMYLIRANSRPEAEQIAAGDPFTAGGDCSFELIDWQINEILGVGFRALANLPPR